VSALKAPILAVLLPAFIFARSTGADPARPLSFERDIWPIIAANCTSCHGADKPKAGLDLRTVSGMLKGGAGGPALDLGDPDRSLLVAKIAQSEMPPGKARKLTREEVAKVREWVRSGARAEHTAGMPAADFKVREQDRRFWSFRTLQKPTVPMVVHAGRARTPVDAFLLERLKHHNLSFSPDAEPATLLRRLCLDLTGIPPPPELIDAFEADHEPGAFERVVDRLLTSPQFGERWGRHWLDVAGYVDTVGFDTDATNIITSPGKWRYRDYVIAAFNADKPYDQFITEQIAGDELHDWRKAAHWTSAMREALIATGYLRTARDLTQEDVGVIPQNFYGIMHDTLEIVGTGLLGLTLNCARCHDHKFDPIPQQDYYRLMAILTPAYNPQNWLPVVPTETRTNDRGLPDVSPAERALIERHNAAVDRELELLRRRLSQLRQPCHERLFASRLAALPEPIRADTRTALQTAPEKRSEVQKYLAEKLAAAVVVKPEEVTSALLPTEKSAAAQLETQIHATEGRRRSWGKIQVLYDVGPPPPSHLLVRGNEQTPGPQVSPGFLGVLCASEPSSIATPAVPFEDTSGRRLAFARWLTRRDSPASALLARVMVNRAWSHLFGDGIVTTVDNFGVQGQTPTHPQLLEWLSSEFVASGWRLKPLIRLLVTSTAYRQASRRDGFQPALAERDPETIDPANRLLWRMRLRRLEGEAVRDAILATSGDLDRASGGRPISIKAQPDGMVTAVDSGPGSAGRVYRRSVYLTARRAYNLSLLAVFDQPQIATNCAKRTASAVPLQSLFMINDAFLAEQADHFAGRVERAARGGKQAAIECAFRLALARPPNANEVRACGTLLDNQARLYQSRGDSPAACAHQALAQLCLTLFNTSEFLFAE
jgi:mono/diheme cytochrome c family protein